MDINELIGIVKEYGVAGSGGAGFPSYAKLDQRTDTLILNSAECEPLLKVHRQLLQKYAYEIMSTLNIVAEAVNAKQVIIAVKSAYEKTIEAVQSNLDSFPNMSIKLLQEVYPTGDEVVLIYDTLGRVVPPGSIPIEVGVTVFNVETMFNIYKAINNQEGVYTKYLTVAGEVKHPVTIKVPIGMTVKDVVLLAGGPLIKDPVYISGGPMTGNIVNSYETITKTTNAILVLPKDHYVVRKKESNISIDLKRATSTCCQCEMCTDLCPRSLLGHPITPHLFMRHASSGTTGNATPFLNTLYCSSCGICEMYACPQELSPRKLIMEYKNGLRKNGIRPQKGIEEKEVNSNREYRKVPMERLIGRLGLIKYNIEADLVEEVPMVNKVKINLSQHIGAKAVPVVSKGDVVTKGQMIGKAEDGTLSIPVHASITGKVMEVNNKLIMIHSV